MDEEPVDEPTLDDELDGEPVPPVGVVKIGSREFLQVGRYTIPVDQIKEFDRKPDGLERPDGTAVSGVNILMISPTDIYLYRGSMADRLKEYLDSL